MNLAARYTSLLLLSLWLVPWAQGIEKLKCATIDGFYPLSYMQDNQLAGTDVDQFIQAARRLNLKVDLIPLPFTRILRKMEEGTLDCMLFAFKTPDRQVYMDYTSVPIHVASLVFYVKNGGNITFNTLEDLKGLTVGLVRGFKSTGAFNKAMDQGLVRVEYVTNVEQNFQKLSFGRLDLVLVSRIVGDGILKKLRIDNIRSLPVPLVTQPAYLTFSKKRRLTHLIPLFDNEFAKAKQDSSYQTIIDKYITE